MFAASITELASTTTDLELLGLAGLTLFLVIVAVKYGKAVLS